MSSDQCKRSAKKCRQQGQSETAWLAGWFCSSTGKCVNKVKLLTASAKVHSMLPVTPTIIRDWTTERDYPFFLFSVQELSNLWGRNLYHEILWRQIVRNELGLSTQLEIAYAIPASLNHLQNWLLLATNHFFSSQKSSAGINSEILGEHWLKSIPVGSTGSGSYWVWRFSWTSFRSCLEG